MANNDSSKFLEFTDETELHARAERLMRHVEELLTDPSIPEDARASLARNETIQRFECVLKSKK